MHSALLDGVGLLIQTRQVCLILRFVERFTSVSGAIAVERLVFIGNVSIEYALESIQIKSLPLLRNNNLFPALLSLLLNQPLHLTAHILPAIYCLHNLRRCALILHDHLFYLVAVAATPAVLGSAATLSPRILAFTASLLEVFPALLDYLIGLVAAHVLAVDAQDLLGGGLHRARRLPTALLRKRNALIEFPKLIPVVCGQGGLSLCFAEAVGVAVVVWRGFLRVGPSFIWARDTQIRCLLILLTLLRFGGRVMR